MKKLPEPPSEALELGKAVHTAIELIHHGMLHGEAVDRAVRNASLPVSAAEVAALVRNADIVPGEGEVEAEFMLRLDRDVWIYGLIDWIVDHGDGTVTVTDWKTNRVEEDVLGTHQLDLYAAAAFDVFGARRVVTRYVFVRTGNVREKAFDAPPEEALAWARETAAEIIERGEAEENYRPNHGLWCKYCPFAMQCYALWGRI
ncbi:MAG: PD-(D/E)XK nuclease family protein [Hydrogenibacillus schlegelii]|uniref:PD-(D/E)XK nuclease family protein n=1 Tax=Hydrogenibacillus schlegelii TaxID=1484 RepID=A0A947CWH5_HYDSH|nr:PD-(D/E)XK nuclease family protein [Hydrogenibacillus schlegelii]